MAVIDIRDVNASLDLSIISTDQLAAHYLCSETVALNADAPCVEVLEGVCEKLGAETVGCIIARPWERWHLGNLRKMKTTDCGAAHHISVA